MSHSVPANANQARRCELTRGLRRLQLVAARKREDQTGAVAAEILAQALDRLLEAIGIADVLPDELKQLEPRDRRVAAGQQPKQMKAAARQDADRLAAHPHAPEARVESDQALLLLSRRKAGRR